MSEGWLIARCAARQEWQACILMKCRGFEVFLFEFEKTILPRRKRKPVKIKSNLLPGYFFVRYDSDVFGWAQTIGVRFMTYDDDFVVLKEKVFLRLKERLGRIEGGEAFGISAGDKFVISEGVFRDLEFIFDRFENGTLNASGTVGGIPTKIPLFFLGERSDKPS